jgi:type II secretion system protein N
MLDGIKKFFRAIANSKLKIFLAFLSVLVFLVVLFPVNDLGDLVSTQVAQLTKNQVFLQFDDLQMSVFPGPGLKVSQVHVETPTLPPILAQEIKVAPSISGLIAQQPYGTVNAKGLFGGDIVINVKSGARSDNGVARQRVELTANRLNLQDLRELGHIPVMMKGKLDVSSVALVDVTFAEQPEVELTMNINQFEIPPSTLALEDLGDLAIPEIKVSRVDLKGRLAAGNFIIENGVIGKEGDDLQGTIKGNLTLTFAKSEFNPNGAVQPVLGPYSLSLDLRPSRKLQDSAATMLSFLDSYKSTASDGIHYKIKVSGDSFRAPPSLGVLR